MLDIHDDNFLSTESYWVHEVISWGLVVVE
jgi:hypothetical protein